MFYYIYIFYIFKISVEWQTRNFRYFLYLFPWFILSSSLESHAEAAVFHICHVIYYTHWKCKSTYPKEFALFPGSFECIREIILIFQSKAESLPCIWVSFMECIYLKQSGQLSRLITFVLPSHQPVKSWNAHDCYSFSIDQAIIQMSQMICSIRWQMWYFLF